MVLNTCFPIWWLCLFPFYQRVPLMNHLLQCKMQLRDTVPKGMPMSVRH